MEDNIYLFLQEPKKYEINIDYIAKIEKFYQQHGFIPENCVNTFLDWLVMEARKKCLNSEEDFLNFSYKGCCGRVQGALKDLLDRMRVPNKAFNIGNVVAHKPIHALNMLTLPILKNDKVVLDNYILDPTFRQFTLKEENRFERYFEEERGAIKVATPHPGYFLNLTPQGREFANELIKDGYFLMNDENTKLYCDAFQLYVTPKEDYTDKSLVGKVSFTGYSGADYIKLINTNLTNFAMSDIYIEDPVVSANKISRKIKKLFKKKDDSIEIEKMLNDSTSNVPDSKFYK